MSKNLTSDGTRLHDHNGRARAADLQPGDTYTRHTDRGPITHTVTGAPYTDQIHTPQGHTVTALRVPVQAPDGTHIHDTVSPDPEENLL